MVIVETFQSLVTLARVVVYVNHISILHYAFALAKLMDILKQSGMYQNMARNDLIDITLPSGVSMPGSVREDIGVLVIYIVFYHLIAILL